MSTQEIQAEKFLLIEWITQLQDSSLIEKLMSLRSKNSAIPKWQKEEVAKRQKATASNPDRLLNWEDVKDSFKLD